MNGINIPDDLPGPERDLYRDTYEEMFAYLSGINAEEFVANSAIANAYATGYVHGAHGAYLEARRRMGALAVGSLEETLREAAARKRDRDLGNG